MQSNSPLVIIRRSMQDDSSSVLQAAGAAMEALGIELTNYTSASTDQNVPMLNGYSVNDARYRRPRRA